MGLELLKIIGNGDAFGTAGKFHTSFYLESAETNFLVDLGSTAIHNLQPNVNFNKIDLIVISHFHGDHFGGIPFFLLSSAFLLKRERPLIIVGPEGCSERVMSLTESLYKGIIPKLENLDLIFHEYVSGVPLKIRDLEILGLPVIHSNESNPHSLRITSGDKKFAYSGDTEWTGNLFKISEGVDFFICECTYYSTEMGGHINYLKSRDDLKKIDAKKTLLTHMGQEMLDEAIKAEVLFEYSEENKIYKF